MVMLATVPQVALGGLRPALEGQNVAPERSARRSTCSHLDIVGPGLSRTAGMIVHLEIEGLWAGPVQR